MVRHLVKIVETMSFETYTEPFAGGAALLFALPVRSGNSNYRKEAINDSNGLVANCYRVAREQPVEFQRLLELTPHSQEEHKRSLALCKAPTNNAMEMAWAFYVNINQSFAKTLNAGWSTSTGSENHAYTWHNLTSRLPESLGRLSGVSIGNEDALKFIDRWDSPKSLHYCDPPYPNTDQGHYKGYTVADYKNLVEKLDNIKGSFILSNYSQDVTHHESWSKLEIPVTSGAAKHVDGVDRSRTEVIWYHSNSTQNNVQQSIISYETKNGSFD